MSSSDRSHSRRAATGSFEAPLDSTTLGWPRCSSGPSGPTYAPLAGSTRPTPGSLAIQLWITTHGGLTLHLAELLTVDAALDGLVAMGTNLCVGFGDGRDAAARSVATALERQLGSVPDLVSLRS